MESCEGAFWPAVLSLSAPMLRSARRARLEGGSGRAGRRFPCALETPSSFETLRWREALRMRAGGRPQILQTSS